MRRLGWLIALALNVSGGWAAKPTATVVGDRILVDGMAAKIDGQTITVSDARFFLALKRYRDKQEPLAKEASGELKSALQRLLLEEMVYAELKALKFDGGPRSAAEKEVADRKKAPRSKAWNQILSTYGKTDPAAVESIWKSLQVERFLQRRVETMTPFVTPSEVDAYLRQKAPPDRQPDEKELVKMRPAASQELRKERMRKELEEWVLLLKRKYSVTNYLEG
ncbi:hypothetical protein K2X33_14935 [bacterium]|nr:hypothetical protein [bacterium]